MKTTRQYFPAGILISLLLLSPCMLSAQGVAEPLVLKGLDRTVPQGARFRAMGGAAFAMSGDVTAMFNNPAGLMGLSSSEFRIGATNVLVNPGMTQEWYINDYIDIFSLIVENKPEYWPTLDALNSKFRSDSLTKFRNGRLFNVRLYDDLQTGWEKKKARFLPSMVAAAFPLIFKGEPIVVGLGYAELINLDSYFQNNTAMEPYLGQFRPAPIPVFKTINDSLRVRLFTHSTQRQGSIYGVTPSVALSPFNGLNIGFAYTVLSGRTEDKEEQRDRAIIMIRTLSGRSDIDPVCQLDPSNYYRISEGRSDFSGSFVNFGMNYKREYFSIGGTVRPSYTITRTWERNVTKQVPSDKDNAEMGEEKMTLPLSFGIGLAIFANERVTIAMDYESRNLTEAEFSITDSINNKPWLNGSRYRFGVEYRPIYGLALRCGYREEAEVFARAGAAIQSIPERSKIFTAGAGLQISFFTLDLAYEFRRLNYFDSWESNTNFITDDTHTLVVEASIRF